MHIEKDNNYIVFVGLSIKSRSSIYLPFVSFSPILNEDNSKLVTLISVSSDLGLANPLVKTLDFLCVDEEIKLGDLVLLPNKNKAKVISILKCKEDDLELPKELYGVAKKI